MPTKPRLDADFLARRIAQAMSLRSLSQADLAGRTGISTGHVSMLLSGGRDRPSADVVYRIAIALEVGADWLMGLPERGNAQNLAPEEDELIALFRVIPHPKAREMILNAARVQAELFEHD